MNQIQLGSIASVDVQIELTQLCCGRKQHSGAELITIQCHGTVTKAQLGV